MISIEQLAKDVRPNRTVLFFGAGSSIPSGLPSGEALRSSICKEFEIATRFTLAETALLAELSTSRERLIAHLRKIIGKPSPTGALLNLPVYPWKCLYTTNYDDLIE